MEPKKTKKRPQSNQKFEIKKKEPVKKKIKTKSQIKMKKDTFGCYKSGACPKCGLFHSYCFCCYGSCPIHGRPMIFNNVNKITINNNINIKNINNVNNVNNAISFKNKNDLSFS